MKVSEEGIPKVRPTNNIAVGAHTNTGVEDDASKKELQIQMILTHPWNTQEG